jgi:hypothetical protein
VTWQHDFAALHIFDASSLLSPQSLVLLQTLSRQIALPLAQANVPEVQPGICVVTSVGSGLLADGRAGKTAFSVPFSMAPVAQADNAAFPSGDGSIALIT